LSLPFTDNISTQSGNGSPNSVAISMVVVILLYSFCNRSSTPIFVRIIKQLVAEKIILGICYIT
jgi:uncharacterized protein YqhQ